MTSKAMILAGLLAQTPASTFSTSSITVSKAPASTRDFTAIKTAYTSAITGGDHHAPSKLRQHHTSRVSILDLVVGGRHGGDGYSAMKKCGGGDTWIGTRA